MSLRILQRVMAMDRTEARFRAASAWRRSRERHRFRRLPPRWRRGALPGVLTGDETLVRLCDARTSAMRHDWRTAHRLLAEHFAERRSAFPVDPCDVGRIADEIVARVPSAPADAGLRASRIMAGTYDVLGYAGVSWGTPPDWHADPVHHGRAASGYWADIAYLDSRLGDHKVIWEINRHQHWLALGRARHLARDPRCYDEFVAQLASWLAANPPLSGINWASMLEVAFRTMSWLWALQFFCADGARDAGATWLVDLLVALDAQLQHVERNLSLYFSPNTHLTGEALALYVAGLTLPELAASGRRAALGRTVLLREAQRQILGDGVHAELSGHYHRYSTDFYLFALNVARRAHDSAAPAFEAAARRQARALRVLCDDAGRRPRIGDDDGGQLFPVCGRDAGDCADTLAIAAVLLNEPDLAVGSAPEEALWMCGSAMAVPRASSVATRLPSTVLREAGYVVSRTPEGDQLIFDAGRHGYLNGGHAHADALAIVATAGGLPLLADPGTATYTVDAAARDRFRSTAMHNTVVVGGRSQSIPNGPFHWRSRADGSLRFWRFGNGCDYAEASHDGYAPVLHIRSLLAVHGLGWIVIDRVLGPGVADAEAYWHLEPAWHVRPQGLHAVSARASGRLAALASSLQFDIVGPEHGSGLSGVSPAYGRVVPSHTLRSRVRGALPLTFCTWIIPNAARLMVHGLEAVSVSGAPPGTYAAAFRARTARGEAWILTAIDASGPEPSFGASGPSWGTSDVETDGRLAFVLVSDEPGSEAVVVDGGRVRYQAIEHCAPAAEAGPSIERFKVAMAPDLHEPAGAHRN